MPRTACLTVLIAVALAISGGSARPAAIVGETRIADLPPAPAPDTDAVKAQYRRPDTVPFPPGNPYTPEKAQLGHILYNDTRLSGTGTLSCASCHNPGFSYGDGQQAPVGRGQTPGKRRSPSIIDGAWGDSFMWDGRANTLEEQAIGPITNPAIMGNSIDRLTSMLSAIPAYRALFTAAFPHQPITAGAVADAIATYERTIVSGTAPFDAWIEGDANAIPQAAKRGFELFNTKAHCASCHSGWTFSDEGFHDIGLPDDDPGRGRLLPQVPAMAHAFKTPNLRDVDRRGPYMHDGSLPTLQAVVAHYDQGGVARPSRSPLIMPLGLSPAEQSDIVAFLRTLTSPPEPEFIPTLPQ